MSLECSECECDLRGGHAEGCSRDTFEPLARAVAALARPERYRAKSPEAYLALVRIWLRAIDERANDWQMSSVWVMELLKELAKEAK